MGRNTSGEISGISPPISVPSRRVPAARPPVGILSHLVFIGLVATLIIVVSFGGGFFLLAREAAPVSGAAETPDSAVVAALPVFPLAEPSAMGKTAPPQEGDATRVSAPVSSIGQSTASAAKGATPSGEVPAPRTTAGWVRIVLPPHTASAPPPAATSGNPAPIRRGERGYSWQRDAPPDPEPTVSRSAKPRSNAPPSTVRAAAGRTRSANQNGKLDPEEGAARRENQRVYDQLLAAERAADR
jgi:hypothetical protein